MHVHTLEFKDKAELAWAFEHLLSANAVEDVLSEPDRLRIRFVAPANTASELIQRIYQRGGLTWCLRSPFGPPSDRDLREGLIDQEA